MTRDRIYWWHWFLLLLANKIDQTVVVDKVVPGLQCYDCKYWTHICDCGGSCDKEISRWVTISDFCMQYMYRFNPEFPENRI